MKKARVFESELTPLILAIIAIIILLIIFGFNIFKGFFR